MFALGAGVVEANCAFGAGFLKGWGEITSGPFARPEFDMATGVSTGASYTSATEFYADPEPNWVKQRGVIEILPSHISMFNNCHLQDFMREAEQARRGFDSWCVPPFELDRQDSLGLQGRE